MTWTGYLFSKEGYLAYYEALLPRLNGTDPARYPADFEMAYSAADIRRIGRRYFTDKAMALCVAAPAKACPEPLLRKAWFKGA